MNRSRTPSFVFVSALVLYLSFRSAFFNFDGVACAIAVDLDDFRHLVHGNHLGYGIVAWAFTRVLAVAGPSLPALQLLSALLGSVGAGVFASLLRDGGRSETEAYLAGLALAVSHAWWFWSLEAQVYLMGALFAVLAAREALSEEPRPLVVGLWHGAAALGHVGHLMAAPALLYALWRKGGRRSALDWALGAGGVVLAAYAAAAVFAVRPATFDEARVWLLGSAAMGDDRAFAWHGAAPLDAVLQWLARTLEVFAAPPASVLALLPLAAVVRALWRGTKTARFWGLWLAGYAALFLLWEPGTIVYRVSDLVALWALALEGMDGLAVNARASALAAWCAVAGAANWRNAVSPAGDLAANADLTDALLVGRGTPEDAWALAASRGQVYLPYFAHRRPFNPRWLKGPGELDAALEALTKAGTPVYATARSLELSKMRPEFEARGLTPAGPGLWILRPAASPRAGAGRNR